MMLEALLTKLFQESGALASAVVGGGGVRGRSSTWSSKDLTWSSKDRTWTSKDLTWSSKEAILRSDTARKDVIRFQSNVKPNCISKCLSVLDLLRLHQYLREL